MSVTVVPSPRGNERFISFVEEMGIHETPNRFGRVEVFKEGDQYQSSELRWLYKAERQEAFDAFRDKWDFRTLSAEEFTTFTEELRAWQEDGVVSDWATPS